MNTSRNIGRFTVSGALCRGSFLELRALFAQVIVTRCEHMFWNDTFEYYAISDLFEPVPEGTMIPHYEITFHTQGGVTSVTAKKVQP